MKTKKVVGTVFSIAAISVCFIACNNHNDHMNNLHVVIDSLSNQVNILSEKQKQTEANKKMVAEFYQELFGDKNINAIDKYIADNYIQHNPILPDGKDALKKGAAIWFKGAPKEKIDIQHLNADENLVYIHTRTKMGNKTVSVIDIFRIENGKIAEHWDVIQEVPEKSANPHPMF